VLWDRSDIAEAYLSPSCAGLVTARAPQARWFDTGNLSESCARLAEELSQTPFNGCRRLRVWLASALARPLIVPARSGARNVSEVKALVAMLAADATGLDGPVRTWLARWRADQAALAVVVTEREWTELQETLQTARRLRAESKGDNTSRRLELVSAKPWWNHALDEALSASGRDGSGFGWSLSERDGVVHGLVDGGRIIEAAFETRSVHDMDGALLRRRLEVGWDAKRPARHLVFSRGEGAAPNTNSRLGWDQPLAEVPV
jgi:hypothetical protein